MDTDGYQIYHGGHFVVYANIKSLCSTPETNNIVCQLYFNLKKRERRKKRERENKERGGEKKNVHRVTAP